MIRRAGFFRLGEAARPWGRARRTHRDNQFDACARGTARVADRAATLQWSLTSPTDRGETTLRHTKACVGVAAALVAAATGGLIGPVTPAAPAVVSPSARVVLDWNLNAVTAVRASTPAKFQIEGLIYVSYVQAAVYDAVTKIEGRYVPYHDFAADPTGASPEPGVVSAAYNTLLAYLGDPAGTLLAAYNASLAALPDAGKAEGVAVGKA